MIRCLAAVLTIALLPSLAGCGGTGASGPLPADRSYVVAGRVAAHDGEGLRFASVGLVGTPLGGVTNRNGEFSIPAVSRGSYGMTVLYLGFRSEQVSVLVPGDGRNDLELEMIRDPAWTASPVDSLPPIRVSYEIRTAP